MLKSVNNSQLTLFPETVNDVLKEIPLALSHAELLYKEGLLSFKPELSKNLQPAESAELYFVGVLASELLSLEIIKSLLKSLTKPYQYSFTDIYYDWQKGEWRNFPEEKDLYDIVNEIEDVEELETIRDQIDYKIKDLIEKNP